uniref:Uncharacterized protein n=1 Tax=Manihot esculenta TaxID=3983 RepID=A0A2C9V4H2_MANES
MNGSHYHPHLLPPIFFSSSHWTSAVIIPCINISGTSIKPGFFSAGCSYSPLTYHCMLAWPLTTIVGVTVFKFWRMLMNKKNLIRT